MIDAPGPGIYPDVPFDDYLRWSAVNASLLKEFQRSAKHARWSQLSPPASTRYTDTGSAGHAAVLEPETFGDRYVAAPMGNRATKAIRDAWREIERDNPDKVLLRQSEYDFAIGLQRAVWTHGAAGRLLASPGPTELSIVWIDPHTAVKCKARLDKLGTLDDWSVVGDLKCTSISADPDQFRRHIGTYRYDLSAAFYLDGCDVLAPRPRKFVWIVAETVAPFGIATYEPTPDLLDQGRNDYRRWLEEYAKAEKRDVWPCYPEEVVAIAGPNWLVRPDDWEHIQAVV